jgi:DNA-binding response OmpR family regulator
MSLLKTILVAEDDSELRQVLAYILSEPGYTVVTASDGYAALRVLVERSVDLLLTDLKMPGINGFELAQQARLMRPRLHVIYLSGHSADIESRGPTYGRLVQKPVRAAELVAVIGQEIARTDHVAH